MKSFAAQFISVILSFIMSLSCSKTPSADLIITGGRIYTLEDPAITEALAAREGRIVYVGSEKGTEPLKGPNTKIIHLQGKTLLPGFVDAHAHLIGLGKALSHLNLVGTKSKEEIRNLVLEREHSVPQGRWVLGRGWDQNDWEIKEFPLGRDLEGTERNPVALRRIDGHAVWLNKRALEVCNITASTRDPEGGIIVRDKDRNPTGVLVDNAMDLQTSCLPKPSFGELLEWAASAVRECNRKGLTGMHDAGTDSIGLEVYRELQKRGALSLRVYAMLNPENEGFLDRELARGPHKEEGGFVIVRSVKLYADGALGSRGAALIEPYSDMPSTKGLIVTPREKLLQITGKALRHGFQVCTHAIGDAATRMVLDIYEQVLNEYTHKDARPRVYNRGSRTSNEYMHEDARLRIEHAQVVDLADIPRFSKLGVIPSMQPTHATSDMDWAERRLGPERMKGAYAWRKFIADGCSIACGSDFPVEDVSPLKGIYAAVARQDASGNPPGGWYPEERMTIDEAVRGFTINAAYAEFAEDERGSIKVGKLADFTVLDRDIFSIPPEEILKASVYMTVVDGEVVYEKEPREGF